MKTINLLFILFLSFIPLTVKSTSSEFHLRMLDGSPIMIRIEDFNFDNFSSVYHIGNINQGNKAIEVYSVFKPYPHSNFEYRLIFRGNVFLRAGHITYAEINNLNQFRIVGLCL